MTHNKSTLNLLDTAWPPFSPHLSTFRSTISLRIKLHYLLSMHRVLFFNQPPRSQAFNVQEFMCTALTCTFSNAVIGLNLFLPKLPFENCQYQLIRLNEPNFMVLAQTLHGHTRNQWNSIRWLEPAVPSSISLVMLLWSIHKLSFAL